MWRSMGESARTPHMIDVIDMIVDDEVAFEMDTHASSVLPAAEALKAMSRILRLAYIVVIIPPGLHPALHHFALWAKKFPA
jgi:hypothetical protein